MRKFLASIYFRRASLALLHDVLMAVTAFVLALLLRLGFQRAEDLTQWDLWISAVIFGVVSGAVFLTTGLYRGIWRYASLNDMLGIVRAATLAVLVFLPITFMVTRLDTLPRSSLIVTWLLLIALLSGPRLLYRLLKDGGLNHVLERDTHLRVPVLLIGAGDSAELFISSLKRDANYEVLAVVDEKGRRVGRRIRGIPVVGDLGKLPEILAQMTSQSGRRPQRIILTKELRREQMNMLLALAEDHGVTLDRLPQLTDFKRSQGSEPLLPQPVAIEDLLRRPQIVLDPEPVRQMVIGRRVLVTGAGGSIGSELVRQLAAQDPSEISLVESSEFNLYRMDRELSRDWVSLPRIAHLCDVRDAAALERVFADVRPELVFHAAALKHVPIVEAQPVEGVLTNVSGTRNVADACNRHGVAIMVLISTDKAVNPSNVMGASKRLSESYCQALDLEARRRGSGPRYVTVRFGNVLGSTGSVVPLFQDQLMRGGPLTVTHPDMTRYFMTVGEAVRLVLQSAAVGAHRQSEEAGKIYVLDMGRPVKIVELAEQIIRLSGKRPYRDVDIVFSGLRAGEKLYEELFHDQETLVATDQPGLLLAAPRTLDLAALISGLDDLLAAARAQDDAQVQRLLAKLVPEWHHSAEIVELPRKVR
ncbi:polysaccharide biosynthesis protein [Algihabitans albus]|uniref:polysaccharide biosynthesis protein n=1 Tax=Algihabitans albus TaxID=2164067 RepID=UPI000E5CBF7E|nr:nucleoside-diphosphate sugar epimerase/dehydratase [Algihabitans albus]